MVILTNTVITPLVATSILDSIARDSCQGILLGQDSTCATYSYPTLDESLVSTLLKSHKNTFPKDELIGIYTDSETLIVPEFLYSFISHPILVQVSPTDLGNWKGFQMQKLDTSQIAYPMTLFKRVVNELESQALASISCGLEKEPSLRQEITSQLAKVEELQAYVDKVIQGKADKNTKLGRILLEALSIPPLKDVNEKTSLQARDSLLLLKATQLTMQQLANSEKISTLI